LTSDACGRFKLEAMESEDYGTRSSAFGQIGGRVEINLAASETSARNFHKACQKAIESSGGGVCCEIARESNLQPDVQRIGEKIGVVRPSGQRGAGCFPYA
jgi:hypothetical protein